MQLREYQKTVLQEVSCAFAKSNRVCAVVPTGGGKTVIAASAIKQWSASANVLLVAHRHEIIKQTVDKLKDVGVSHCRVISKGRDSRTQSRVAVASVQTLSSWTPDAMPSADFVVVDEAHHVRARTWERLVGFYPNAKILGLTATPQRGDGRALGDVFKALVIGPTAKELIDLGHLVECRILAPHRELESYTLALAPVDAYSKYSKGSSAIVFCKNVKHAFDTSTAFNDSGISSATVCSGSADRSRAVDDFKSGRIKVICDVYTLTEGFDVPRARVCILARRFKHLGSYLQCVGRVMRPYPGKQAATILDLCGSSLIHGDPAGRVSVSLDGSGMIGTALSKNDICAACGFVNCDCPYKRECLREMEILNIGITLIPPMRFFDFAARKAANAQRARN